MQTKDFLFENVMTVITSYKIPARSHLSTHLIEESLDDIWKWSISNLHLLDQQLSFEKDGHHRYISYMLDKAQDWYSVKGMAMKNNLIGSLKLKPNQDSVNNFLLSIDLLKKRGSRKLSYLTTIEDKESMIEWHLELPFMVKTRLERQGLILEKKDYVSNKYESQEKLKLEVKQETLEGVSLIFLEEGDCNGQWAL